MNVVFQKMIEENKVFELFEKGSVLKGILYDHTDVYSERSSLKYEDLYALV